MATATINRTFKDNAAVREQTPILVGLVGASGSGKTFSALRLASGIQKVTGGDIFLIDTEGRRALHYADQFKFRHVPFAAPFSPLDYLAAVEYCVHRGAKTIVIDSMSHEHDGAGGVLEEHEFEAERLAGLWKTSVFKTTIPAWAVPKAKRRKLLNAMLQMEANFIFCFRAKEKIKIVTGKDPVQLGWMPIAGEEFVYEMTLNCLLYPGSQGVPTWKPDEAGEKMMIKLPGQFREMFAKPLPLSEETGEKLARWATGSKPTNGHAVDPWLLVQTEFAKVGVADNRLLAALGLVSPSQVDAGHLKTLREGLKGIKAGKLKADELFPPIEDDPDPDDDEAPEPGSDG